MTQEQIDKVVKFTAIVVFKYCMGNKLDFSMEEEEDVDLAAEEMYNEMWTDGGASLNKRIEELKK